MNGSSVRTGFSWLSRELGTACQDGHKFFKMYIVYILQSEFDGSYYIGQTEDLERRLAYHNAGMSRYTSRKMPWKVVYNEEYSTRKEAIRRERFLKNQRNRKFYEKLIKDFRSLNQSDSNKI